MTVFSLTIDKRRGSFGESAHSERVRIAALLHDVATKLANGSPLDVTNEITDQGGGAEGAMAVGSFTFGPGAVNEQVEFFDHDARGGPTRQVLPRAEAEKVLAGPSGRHSRSPFKRGEDRQSSPRVVP